MANDSTLATPAGETAIEVTGTGTRPAIIADATTRHERSAVPVQARNERFRSSAGADFPAVAGRGATWQVTRG